LESLIALHLSDSSQGLNAYHSVENILRQSVYSRLTNYEDINNEVRVAFRADATFVRPTIYQTLKPRPAEAEGQLVQHARHYWLLLAEWYLTRRYAAAGLGTTDADRLTHRTCGQFGKERI
jgi:hypothetical protein